MIYNREAPRRSEPLKALVAVYVTRGKRRKRLVPDYFHLHDRNKTDNLFDYFKWLIKKDRWIRRIEFRLYEDSCVGSRALWWVLDAQECLAAWWAAGLAVDFFDVVARPSLMLDLALILDVNPPGSTDE